MPERKHKPAPPLQSVPNNDLDLIKEYKKLNDLCDEILKKRDNRKNLTTRDKND